MTGRARDTWLNFFAVNAFVCGFAVTVDALAHEPGIALFHNFLFFNRPMAFLATDTRDNVRRMIKTNEVVKVVNLDPFNRLGCFCGVRLKACMVQAQGVVNFGDFRRDTLLAFAVFHKTVAVHAGVGSRYRRVTSLLHRTVAVETIDAHVAGMQFVRVGNGLGRLIAAVVSGQADGRAEDEGHKKDRSDKTETWWRFWSVQQVFANEKELIRRFVFNVVDNGIQFPI